jgi:hypothetical protein
MKNLNILHLNIMAPAKKNLNTTLEIRCFYNWLEIKKWFIIIFATWILYERAWKLKTKKNLVKKNQEVHE